MSTLSMFGVAAIIYLGAGVCFATWLSFRVIERGGFRRVALKYSWFGAALSMTFYWVYFAVTWPAHMGDL